MNKKRIGIPFGMSWVLVLSLVLSSIFMSDIVSASVAQDEGIWSTEETKNIEYLFEDDESVNMEISGKKVFLRGIGGRQDALTLYSSEKWNRLSEAEKAKWNPSEYLKAVDVDKAFEAMVSFEMFFIPAVYADRNLPWELGGVRSDGKFVVRSEDEHVFRLVEVPIDANKTEELEDRLELYWKTEEYLYSMFDGTGFGIVDGQDYGANTPNVPDDAYVQGNESVDPPGNPPAVELEKIIEPIVDENGISIKFRMNQTNPEATRKWSDGNPSIFFSTRIDLFLTLKIPPLSEFSEAVASEQQQRLKIVNRDFALQKHHSAPPPSQPEPMEPITEPETTPPVTSPTTLPTTSAETSSMTSPEVSTTAAEAEITTSSEQPETDVTDAVPAAPISEVPNVNPPIDVPFVPVVIENIDRIPPVSRPIFEIINEEGVPLGYAMIDVPQGQYTFVEDEVVPMGTAKIKNDNTLEILDESVPLGLTLPNPLVATLPRTGNADKEAFWFYGLGLFSVALGVVLIKNNR